LVEGKSGRKIGRREWLRVAGKTSATACGLALLPLSIQKALAIPPDRVSGTLNDVQHVVILMQENRSFDHYFGTMSGVRGFGDRILVPQSSGNTVWSQSDGTREILPFHLDTQTTAAMRVPGTPHSWPDAQQAWNQGRFGQWPRFKQFQSMGYYEADDIPFQRALAEAFTICDAHHCSVQSGTLANRTVFMTGTNFMPGMTSPAEAQSEAVIDNTSNRGQQYGPCAWTTYPERLQAAGISWRIYHDPKDNFDGLLAPWEAFAAYQKARAGDPLYDNAMTRWPLAALEQHVMEGTLPQVSWIVPPPVWSEHPAESSPLQGAAYTQKVLEALVANPDVWSRTVFIVTFDENDGFFDHIPPPAPPSIDDTGRILGGSTLSKESMGALYYRNDIAGVTATRPYGMGPRVPLYAISPWSRGGWVCSEVFDHTSTIRFLEARFGVEEPNISSWHRAVSGDLTSCFDFARPDDDSLPTLPDMSYARGEKLVIDLPAVKLPAKSRLPSQDSGVRFSRALPYRLAVQAAANLTTASLEINFENTGNSGAVFHVYDRLHLQQPPYRYTLESGETLMAPWKTKESDGSYDLQILGPNGLLWRLAGRIPSQLSGAALPEVRLRPNGPLQTVELDVWNLGDSPCEIMTAPNMYRSDRVFRLTLEPNASPTELSWPVRASGFWYDFNVTCPSLPGWLRRFAGRLETGKHGVTDPALGGIAGRC
jgi:phospholipase C